MRKKSTCSYHASTSEVEEGLRGVTLLVYRYRLLHQTIVSPLSINYDQTLPPPFTFTYA